MADREKLARQWAEEELKRVSGAVGSTAAAEYILEHTAPPTMADAVWDEEKHYLAGATNSIGDTECVMIAEAEDMIVHAELGEDRVLLTSPGALTPNGKRYELREITEPGHPEVLEQ